MTSAELTKGFRNANEESEKKGPIVRTDKLRRSDLPLLKNSEKKSVAYYLFLNRNYGG